MWARRSKWKCSDRSCSFRNLGAALPNAAPKFRKEQDLSEHFHFERRAHIGAAGNSSTDHAANVEKMQVVARSHRTRKDPFVTLECIAMAERAGDDIAIVQD